MTDSIRKVFLKNGWKEFKGQEKDLILSSLSIINPNKSRVEISDALDDFYNNIRQETSVLSQNKLFLKYLKSGIALGSVKLVDWKKPFNNNFHFASFYSESKGGSRVDFVGFLNGFSVLLIKYSHFTASNFWYQSQIPLYISLYPKLMVKTAIVVMTDWEACRIGSLKTERFSFCDWLDFSFVPKESEFKRTVAALADKEEFLRVIENFSFGDVYGVMEGVGKEANLPKWCLD